MILKGVTIGRGSIVAAGAVVATSVPPFSVVAGNPGRVVKDLENDLD
jgi:acetyltransferase-like isoleucine patch superfamily enzyme